MKVILGKDGRKIDDPECLLLCDECGESSDTMAALQETKGEFQVCLQCLIEAVDKIRRASKDRGWTPKQTAVRQAKEMAEYWTTQQVIVFRVDRRLSTLSMASYGTTKEFCNDAKRMGDAALTAIEHAYNPEVGQ